MWKDWEPRGSSKGRALFSCLVCQVGLEQKVADCKAHEHTQGHAQGLKRFTDSSNPTPSTSTSQTPSGHVLSEDALHALLISATSDPHQARYPLGHPNHSIYINHASPGSPQAGGTLDWGLYQLENTLADPTPQDQVFSDISQVMVQFLNEDISDFKPDNFSDSDDGASMSSFLPPFLDLTKK